MKNFKIIAVVLVSQIMLVFSLWAASSSGCILIQTQNGGSVTLTPLDAKATTFLAGAPMLTLDTLIDEDPFLLNYGGSTGNGYNGGKFFVFNGPTVTGNNPSLRADIYGRRGGHICLNPLTINQSPNAKPPYPVFSSIVAVDEGLVYGSSEIGNPDPNCDDPALYYTLPAVCPYMASQRLLKGLSTGINDVVITDPEQDYLDDQWFGQNSPPQDLFGTHPGNAFDCKNVLKLDKFNLSFDWEDGGILIGTSEDSGDIYEKDFGGVYSNLHYTLVPFQQAYQDQYNAFESYMNSAKLANVPHAKAKKASELIRCANQGGNCSIEEKKAYFAVQYLMHLAHNNTNYTLSKEKIGPDAIDKSAEAPAYRRHSQLPGAFVTKVTGTAPDPNFAQCEWLDTNSQAPNQSITYKNFGLWDWDSDASCAALILWEGDGNTTNFGRLVGWFGPTDISDDFVGYQKICASDFVGSAPKTYSNFSNDISFTLSKGNITSKNCQ